MLALKLHEMPYLTDPEMFKSFFTTQIAADVAHCTHCDVWVHTKALLSEVSEIAARPRVKNSIDFISSFCGAASHSPGGAFASYTDNLDWLGTLLSQSKRNLTISDGGSSRIRLFIMEKCAHKATPEQRTDRYAELTNVVRDLVSSIHIEIVEEELRADDCTAYLQYISSHYEDLPDFMFFIHPDIEEHAMMSLVDRVIKAALNGVLRPDDLPFMYLSHNHLDLTPERNDLWETYAAGKLWKRIFGSSLFPHRSFIQGYCCSQFVVTRDRVLLRSRKFYSEALKIFQSAQSYSDLSPFNVVTPRYDLICRNPCQLNMPWWHVYFGEDVGYKKTSQQAAVPLFIRLLVSG